MSEMPLEVEMVVQCRLGGKFIDETMDEWQSRLNKRLEYHDLPGTKIVVSTFVINDEYGIGHERFYATIISEKIPKIPKR